MILLSDYDSAPTDDHRVYTIPYVVKTNGPIAGTKLGSTRGLGLDYIVQRL